MYIAVASPHSTTPPTVSAEPRREGVGAVEQPERPVGGEPDHERVGDRADAGRLAQRDPEEQDDEAHQDDRLAEGDRHVPDQAGVQHVPGRQAEVAAHHQRQRGAVEPPARRRAAAAAGRAGRPAAGRWGRGRTGSGARAARWWSPVHRRRELAFSGIANRETVACMDRAALRSISAARTAALVGDFDRSPAYAGLADALVLLIGDGRIAPGHPAAERARAHRGARRLPDDRHARVRRAARRRLRRGAAGVGHLHPGPRRPGPRARPGPAPPARRPRGHRPQLRGAERAAGARRGVRRGGRAAARLPRRARLLPGRAARAPGRDRPHLRRARAADRPRARSW